MKALYYLIIAILLNSCGYFSNDRTLDLVPYKLKDKYGYFNLEGKIVINPQFDNASIFNEGIALVKTSGENGKWGYIDKTGKIIINAEYKEATIFNEGIAWVVKDNGSPTAINDEGKTLFSLNEAERVKLYSEKLAAFSIPDSSDVKWGFVDKSGKRIINPQFSDVRSFSDGKCAVKNKDGKWGYIDKEGKMIINYQFDGASDFIDGKSVVSLDDKVGVIDSEGKYIINPQYDYAEIDGDKLLISQESKIGWCDKEGKIIINPQFEEANAFNKNELTPVKSGENYGYIDKDGKFLINPQFEHAFPFINDLALVKSGKKFGIIDKKGKYVVNPQFDELAYDVARFFYNSSIKSLYNSVDSDYIDVNAIINIIKFDNPEGVSFSLTFQEITKKFYKHVNDFNQYNETHILIDKKEINRNADYAFGVIGNIKEIDMNTYNYYITNNKPDVFVYNLMLKNRAYSKTESICKAIEKRLKGYKLVKKGYIEDAYVSVYKNNNIQIAISGNSNSNLMVYIVKGTYDLSYYLNKIKDKKNEVADLTSNTYEQEYVEEAPVADSTAVEVEEYYSGD